jgi:hypothetical protein
MGVYQPKSYTDWINLITAITASSINITDQYGNAIQPNFRVGGIFYTLEQILAITLEAFCQQLATVDAAHRLSSAVGTDLDEIGNITNKHRKGGTYAVIPIKYSRSSAAPSDYTIPTTAVLLARDSSGNASIQLTPLQGIDQPGGVSAILPTGSTSVWGWASPAFTGVLGNIAAGTVVTLGSTGIVGVESVSNPIIARPPAPSLARFGANNGVTRHYSVVVHGLTGTTTQSPVATDSSGPTILDGSNFYIITLDPIDDAVSYDWLRQDAGVWKVIGNTTAATISDIGLSGNDYVLPTSNTANMGIGGEEPEDDEPYRERIPLTLEENAGSTVAAIKATLEDIVGVKKAFVTDAVLAGGGGAPPPGQIRINILPVTSPIHTGTAGDLGSLIDTGIRESKAAGIVASWSEIIPQIVGVTYQLTVTSGTAAQIGSALSDANNAIVAYFDTLSPNQPAYNASVIHAVQDALSNNDTIKSTGASAAVTSVVFAANSTTYTNTGIPPLSGVLYATNTGSISATIIGG